ncbi:hypothetical protein C823_008008 [Eubacterium plexicaudatum ASF492]|nr:hypothetical protein C823_008008 [Eubacterium plexicaudatum ASF492]
MLAQIPWDTEVHFIENLKPDTSDPQAVLFYPEYYEAYDEIAPAHILVEKLLVKVFEPDNVLKII